VFGEKTRFLIKQTSILYEAAEGDCQTDKYDFKDSSFIRRGTVTCRHYTRQQAG
jgi:hypothetical protein